MLRKLRPHRPSHATVVAYLGLFVALGGTAYAVNTVNSSDIVDGQVKSVDVGDGEIKSADVKDQSLTTFDVSTFLGADIVDGSLTASDVGEHQFTNIQVDQPDIGPHSCAYRTIPGVAAQGDHMVLTPDYDTTYTEATYGIEYHAGFNDAEVKICNTTAVTLEGRPTHFNLLVFQH
jgi:hypothetical protein